MNIKEAKEQIKNAMLAYFSKDEFGNYRIPPEKQRPVFLMGAPGIGKTAIMEQIASELGVGLVSYSMTHHTRQSALGLPFIVKKEYGGREYSVSEYTMSEIIASVYEMTEKTGLKEGILFLDEINCVSETLAPAMLQFLQYKIFGRHRIPEGWIVVTAGNPPEYNNSVREFDIATLDRLKKIDVEPDFGVWKEYALLKEMHPSVITYLDIKQDKFYKVEQTPEGRAFVTARGWSDLSEMIKLYEEKGIRVDGRLIVQYVQNSEIAADFAVYYDLFSKYRSDYKVETILEGTAEKDIKERAKKAGFDEKLTLTGLILDSINAKFRKIYFEEKFLTEFMHSIKSIRENLEAEGENYIALLEKEAGEFRKSAEKGRLYSKLSEEMLYALDSEAAAADEIIRSLKISEVPDGRQAFSLIKSYFDEKVSKMQKSGEKIRQELSNIFAFCQEVFPEGQEILIIVTELAANKYASMFIRRYGSEEYMKYNKELLFYERHKDIRKEIEALEL